MSYYECAACQLKRSNHFIEILEFLVSPKCIDHRPVNLAKRTDFGDSIILIRCVKLTAEGYCTEWPLLTTIKVNDKTLLKGANRAEVFDITKEIQGEGGDVKVLFEADYATEYTWTITVCRRRTHTEVLPFLYITRETEERSLALLFNNGACTEATVRILPTKTRLIPHPVRGYLCTHFLCFDMETWLADSFNRKIADWKCPICQKLCLEFRFDALQYQLQTQFSYAIEVDVTREETKLNLHEEALGRPGKIQKTEQTAPFSFEDFLGSMD